MHIKPIALKYSRLFRFEKYAQVVYYDVFSSCFSTEESEIITLNATQFDLSIMNPTMPPYTLAIVEDEAVIRQEMAFQLQQFGFYVEGFESAAQLYRFLAVKRLDLVILDIGLPDEDGISICKYLREHNASIGIVFVTARGQRDDIAAGIATGADAYLTKPIDMTELVQTLQSIATKRTTQPFPSAIQSTESPWSLDANAIYLTTPNAQRIRLTLNESQLLKVLLAKKNQACQHVELFSAIGLPPDALDKHRIEVIISRLIIKIKNQCGIRLPIQSFRGVGYGFILQD